jgi:hypothetical protein
VQKKSPKIIAAAIAALVTSTSLASALPISGGTAQPRTNIITVGGHHHGGHHFHHGHHGGGWGGWDNDWGWGPWVGLGILGLGLAAAASENYQDDCWRQPNGRVVCDR